MWFCGSAGRKPGHGTRTGLVRGAAILLLAALSIAAAGPVRAQAIAIVVNGDPVTTFDVDQRMKLLRALHRPASRDAAVESMISDRLKYREAAHYGVIIKDNEIGDGITLDAQRMKTTAPQLLAEIEHAGVQREHYSGYFKAELAYYILVKELNKGVEASETAVRDELAKVGGKNSIIQYTVRQVVLTIDPGDTPAVLAARGKEAEALRAKFSNCEQGIPYAKALPGVAVREQFTRTSNTLPAQIKDLLDKTPVGHLTPPSRSSAGIEMIAVCQRGAPKDDTEVRKIISDRLLQHHIDEDAASRLKELRAHAIIEKR